MKSGSKDLIVKETLCALESVLGPGPVTLHEPVLAGNEWHYLKECLDSTFVSSVGEFVDKFEYQLTKYTGAKHAVAVVNGTAALHIALLLAGVVRGDEVLVPALTFVATVNSIAYCGASPHFVDSEEGTLGIDPTKLQDYLNENTFQQSGNCINKNTGSIIRAIMPMHTFGHPVAIREIIALADEHNISVIEDASESLGSFYQGKHTGTFGQLGTLSFNGNKTITTGGGGAILTNDTDLAVMAKHLTTTAKCPHDWEYKHDQIGYNYRMPNINAALGCAQLEQLQELLVKKRKLFRRYNESFRSVTGVNLVSEPEGCQSNYWLQTIILKSEYCQYRDDILKATNAAGYMARPAWNLISEMDVYSSCPRMNLECAYSLVSRLINIPSSSNLIDL